MDPDINRYVLVNEAKGFVPGYPDSMRKILGTNIAEVHGAVHKRIRGSLLSLIGPMAVKDHLLPEVDEFMSSFLHNWDGKIIDLQEKTVQVCISLITPELIKPSKHALGSNGKSIFLDKIELLFLFESC